MGRVHRHDHGDAHHHSKPHLFFPSSTMGENGLTLRPDVGTDEDLASKTILVTGGNGFLGRVVVAKLHSLGCKRVAAPNHAKCDLTRMEDVSGLIQRVQPDVVIHLAARVGGIGANRRYPGTFLYQNLMMGVNLIEACRAIPIQKFVCIGTICAYPKFAEVPFQESALWDGYPEETNAPYGLAKKLLLVQLQSYREEFGFPGIYLLPVNLYGPGDNFDLESSHVIPAMIRKMIEARDEGAASVTLWGTGTATREFLYVDDAAEGILAATQRYDSPLPVNLGTGREISIRELAELIAKKCEFRGELLFDPSYPDGQPRRCLDVTRAQVEFGFSAATSLEAGLDHTIEWFQQQRRANRAA